MTTRDSRSTDPGRSEAGDDDPGRLPLRQAIREIVYGMAGFEFARHAKEHRGHLETLFMVVTLGDVIGLPVLPPYYSLRLLPYATRDIGRWKRRVLRERHFTEEHEFDLHGL